MLQSKLSKTVLAAAMMAALVACKPQPSSDAASGAPMAMATQAIVGAPEGVMVAEVNGEKITQPMLEVFAKARKMDISVPEQREVALQSMIETTLLAQDAIKSNLLNDPLIQSEVALARVQQLAGRRMHDWRENMSATDAELKAYYDQEIAKAGAKEYHLQQLQFADQAKAEEALKKANAPKADFDKLLVEYAQGDGYNANDFGFINISQLEPLPPLAEAVKNMKDGAISDKVVASKAGYHVIRLVASRTYEPPKFEDVKEQAKSAVLQQKMVDAVKNLRASADVVTP